MRDPERFLINLYADLAAMGVLAALVVGVVILTGVLYDC